MLNYLPHFAKAYRRHELVADQKDLSNTITNSHNSNLTNIVLPSQCEQEDVDITSLSSITFLSPWEGHNRFQPRTRTQHTKLKARTRSINYLMYHQIRSILSGIDQDLYFLFMEALDQD
jgi:hypothetical protein